VSGGDYLAAAYLVVLFVLLVYVVIIALKLARLDRDLAVLAELARRRREQPADRDREEAHVG
jgi:hypothetical protein